MRPISVLSLVARDLHCDVTGSRGESATVGSAAADSILLIPLNKDAHRPSSPNRKFHPVLRIASPGDCCPKQQIASRERCSRMFTFQLQQKQGTEWAQFWLWLSEVVPLTRGSRVCLHECVSASTHMLCLTRETWKQQTIPQHHRPTCSLKGRPVIYV